MHEKRDAEQTGADARPLAGLFKKERVTRFLDTIQEHEQKTRDWREC
ncbi:MAG TPA: hypothetical protein VKM55_02230 [Candidatus Lokiarchaeia archaeon]|nr:hypothetical protein [Candidatus Lokiarchaeia archaeon]